MGKRKQICEEIPKSQARSDGTSPAKKAKQDSSAENLVPTETKVHSGEKQRTNLASPVKLEKKKEEKKSRYILYVTNIPYDAVKEDITKHFSALKDKLVSIRMLTDKGTGQFRGTCFIDCADKESYAVALKLHHTKMHDRKIVVEPTVGGGGKGANRMQKLTKKRQKFSEVRKKKMRKESKKKHKPSVGGGKKIEGS